ncbi:MAG: integron [Pseudomonadota bacterium]
MNAIRRASLAGLAILSLSPLVGTAAQPSPAEVPVRVGHHQDLDACGSWAAVSGLKPGGDGFLAVRSGPGARYAMRDRLREGDTFFVCGESEDGKWFAIVYSRKGQDSIDCGVGSPVPEETVYRGPCAWGWVHVDWVEILAG